MLLLHQTGSVHVGEVVRYTLTYTPSADRILPPPQHLHLKVKNTSAIPLRAAYLHGPYTLYAACYPQAFDPYRKFDRHHEEGAPAFEPNLKAGGQWQSRLLIPEDVRATATTNARHSPVGSSCSVSWIIEISSQVIFSASATVHFDILVGRDERSVELGSYPVAGAATTLPGKLEDATKQRAAPAVQKAGVYSKAVTLHVADTECLWNTPSFPWREEKLGEEQAPDSENNVDTPGSDQAPARKKKVHLVIVTHGIHGNVGADMLFLKESIEATANQARQDAKARKAQMQAKKLERDQSQVGKTASMSTPDLALAPTEAQNNDESEDDEQVIVRGFQGNVIRTERGIQYLGKRLAKYVLSITYPDQPYLPVKSSISKNIVSSLSGHKNTAEQGQPAHKKSTIVKAEGAAKGHAKRSDQAHRISSISFVGHSLGGITQTYAIAYIKKHSPEFFDKIKPVNFVAMASPFLGLSNENPMYVRFALDFGLVGRTGQDLGLTWRAPNMVRTGWSAMIGGLGNQSRRGSNAEADPGAKPLLRILPSGPAHAALKQFRNRSVYSNVVNDGIVPLRTSCLLFLDWRGLDRVEKARRDNGLVGTMVGWGWAEMMGQNASSGKGLPWVDFFNDNEDDVKKGKTEDDRVPQPDNNAMAEDALSAHNVDVEPQPHQFINGQAHEADPTVTNQQPTPWSGFLSFFKPHAAQKQPHFSPKQTKIYNRSQTTTMSDDSESSSPADVGPTPTVQRVRGPSFYSDVAHQSLVAPPKTTFFESAGDVLKPPLPSKEFILDPSTRPHTIFHDRIYHPQDIPPPPTKEPRHVLRRSASRERMPKHTPSSSTSSVPKPHPDHSSSTLGPQPSHPETEATMRPEEKIARAYHRDLSWRKVLVRLEPDAHNNMVVRRMFANAYGWPVIRHMCDTHFGFTASAQTDDSDEDSVDRAELTTITNPAEQEGPTGQGAPEVHGQRDPPPLVPNADTDPDNAPLEPLRSKTEPFLHVPVRTDSEIRESTDQVPDLNVSAPSPKPDPDYGPASTAGTEGLSGSSSNIGSTLRPSLSRRGSRADSARWSDRFFEGTDDDDSDDDEDGSLVGGVGDGADRRSEHSRGLSHLDFEGGALPHRAARHGPSRSTAAAAAAAGGLWSGQDEALGNKGTSEAEIADFLALPPSQSQSQTQTQTQDFAHPRPLPTSQPRAAFPAREPSAPVSGAAGEGATKQREAPEPLVSEAFTAPPRQMSGEEDGGAG